MISGKTIEKKADYALVLGPRESRLKSIHMRLGWSEMLGQEPPLLGHTTDLLTRYLPICSGFEVKKHGGSTDEAQFQLALWLASSVRHRREIFVHMRHHQTRNKKFSYIDAREQSAGQIDSVESAHVPQPPQDMIDAIDSSIEKFEPDIGVTMVGPEWSAYIAYHDVDSAYDADQAVVGHEIFHDNGPRANSHRELWAQSRPFVTRVILPTSSDH